MSNHEAWLKIAQEDLKAAEGLLALELFSPVTYHCQQSAEKSLKAYLVFKKHSIVRTHDLIQLVELCMKFDRGFEDIFDATNALNPFSTKFRYPTEYDIPDFDDAEKAIGQAHEVLIFVLQKILNSKFGQKDLF